MSRDPLRIAIACLFALLFLAVFLYGWVTDDAFITFRVVRNFLAGDGPVYNLGERVQAYTHPLWFWLLSVGIGLGAESYHFALWLGYIFSAGFIPPDFDSLIGLLRGGWRASYAGQTPARHDPGPDAAARRTACSSTTLLPAEELAASVWLGSRPRGGRASS